MVPNDSEGEAIGTENQVVEEREADLARIAEQLAALSVADEYPAGFAAAGEPFEPEDVQFQSDAWLLRVLDVQTWLHLDESVDRARATSDPAAAALELFKMLGADPAPCVESTDGVTRPSKVGAALLSRRLDSAVRLKLAFGELRESLSRRQATDRWDEMWDEEPSGTAVLEPVKATADVWPIQAFTDKAIKNRLNLSPTYQRGDVWSTDLYQQLIISILRGIPLPSIILLRPHSRGSSGKYEVVDGKQRLTAILRFTGKYPDALQRVKSQEALVPGTALGHHFATNYKKFRRLWKTHFGESLTATKEAEYYFPFRLPQADPALTGPLEQLSGKHYYEIVDAPVHIGALEETVQEVFDTMSSYRIPTIEYLDAAPRQIHEVFHLYNRQGKHLNAEEIRNALFHELGLMRLLLFASADNREQRTLAPYLDDAEIQRARAIGAQLTDYGFGTSRYKRTKLLSWLVARVLQSAVQPDGTLAVRSTAKHIDAMLEAVEADIEERGSHARLAQASELRALVNDLHRCIEVHSSCFGPSCAPAFKDDGSGNKWQELQLVASLVAVFLVCIARPDAADLLEQHHNEIRSFTAQHLRPEKTQNRTQWGFIGKVATGLIDLMGINTEQLDAALRQRYGTSCLPTLKAATEHYVPREQGSGSA